jgi:catechol 2,3-dioxygenase-like lactoylglutathione lyase family enzyme
MSEAIENERRPPVAVGHVHLAVSDIARATDYFVGLGLRKISQRETFAVLELRGGTHLQMTLAEEPIPPGQKASFDLMVDDLEAAREEFEKMGLSPTGITPGRVHSEFHLIGPDGYELTITSSHTSGRIV